MNIEHLINFLIGQNEPITIEDNPEFQYDQNYGVHLLSTGIYF
jgi:hypothetical protein